MELQQLKGFHAVARYKNFTVAAKKTLRTQPTISLQIKALEDELDVKLFERLGPKRVVLTPEGQLLYDLTINLVEEIESIKQRFNESRGIFSSSSIRIVTHSSVMVYYLPSVIKQFKALYPDCHITILNRRLEGILSLVDNGEVDLGISSAQAIPRNMEYKVFSRVNRILIGVKNHPLAKKRDITLEDIASCPLVLPTQESSLRKKIDELFAAHNLPCKIAVEVLGREAIKSYVGMNLGISIINEYYLRPEDTKKLFMRNVSNFFGDAETGVILRKGKILSPPAQEFINLLFSKERGDERIAANMK